MASLSVAIILPFSPAGAWFGFRAPPPATLAGVAVLVAAYLVLTELVKPWAIGIQRPSRSAASRATPGPRSWFARSSINLGPLVVPKAIALVPPSRPGWPSVAADDAGTSAGKDANRAQVSHDPSDGFSTSNCLNPKASETRFTA